MTTTTVFFIFSLSLSFSLSPSHARFPVFFFRLHYIFLFFLSALLVQAPVTSTLGNTGSCQSASAKSAGNPHLTCFFLFFSLFRLPFSFSPFPFYYRITQQQRISLFITFSHLCFYLLSSFFFSLCLACAGAQVHRWFGFSVFGISQISRPLSPLFFPSPSSSHFRITRRRDDRLPKQIRTAYEKKTAPRRNVWLGPNRRLWIRWIVIFLFRKNSLFILTNERPAWMHGLRMNGSPISRQTSLLDESETNRRIAFCRRSFLALKRNRKSTD